MTHTALSLPWSRDSRGQGSALRRRFLGSGTVATALALALAACAAPSGEPQSSEPTDAVAPEVTAPAADIDEGGDEQRVAVEALGSLVATTEVDDLSVHNSPGGADVAHTLSRHTLYEWERALRVVSQETVDGVEWFEVLLPLKPNGQTGWVSGEHVSISSTSISIEVSLEDRTLTLRDGDEVLLTTPVAVGAPDTPTPTGEYYVTDPVDLTADTSSVYGAFALGLSGYSEVLGSFGGGPPQIAIHGTNQPQSIGNAVSNGCIRLPNDAVLHVAAFANPGTPVTII